MNVTVWDVTLRHEHFAPRALASITPWQHVLSAVQGDICSAEAQSGRGIVLLMWSLPPWWLISLEPFRTSYGTTLIYLKLA